MPRQPLPLSPAPYRNGLLFVCPANSARSQMAEGFARLLAPAQLTVYSAGSEPSNVEPFAIKAMKEVGIDISTATTKALTDIPIERVAAVITLCEDDCPPLPDGVSHLHWPVPDPAATQGSDDDVMSSFRRVRDEIRELVSRLF